MNTASGGSLNRSTPSGQPERVHLAMHVIDRDGDIRSGVPHDAEPREDATVVVVGGDGAGRVGEVGPDPGGGSPIAARELELVNMDAGPIDEGPSSRRPFPTVSF